MQRNPRSTPQAGLFKQYSPSIAANKHCIIPNSFSFPVNMRFVKLSSGMASVKNAKNDTSSITPLFCVNKSKNFESVKIHKQFSALCFNQNSVYHSIQGFSTQKRQSFDCPLL